MHHNPTPRPMSLEFRIKAEEAIDLMRQAGYPLDDDVLNRLAVVFDDGGGPVADALDQLIAEMRGVMAMTPDERAAHMRGDDEFWEQERRQHIIDMTYRGKPELN